MNQIIHAAVRRDLARTEQALRATIPGPVVTVLTTVLARRYRREVAPVWR